METSFVIILFYSLAGAGSINQDYSESLLLKLLPDGKVLAHFDHVIAWEDTSPLAMTSFSNG